jgi:RNA methyltransferase, TrmH family
MNQYTKSMHFSPLPKAKLTLLRKLQLKKYRLEFQLYLAEGSRLVTELLQKSPEEIEFIVTDENNLVDLNTKTLFTLPSEQFQEFTETQHSQGVFAIVKMPKPPKMEVLLSKSNLVVVCDAVQDPGNLGTIVRNSIWFGADALVLGEGTVDLYNPKTIRSCMSSLSTIPIVQAKLEEFLQLAELQGFQTYLFRLDSDSQELSQLSFEKKALLVIGNEGNGIQKSLLKKNRTSVLIPDYSNGKTESLNVSIATGIALYEYRSQHKQK